MIVIPNQALRVVESTNSVQRMKLLKVATRKPAHAGDIVP
jgi:hypothetical protein